MYSIAPSLFQQQMDLLAASGIPVVPLDKASTRRGSVAITFDDGYRNLLDHAIPALKFHNFPATIFVVSEYCGHRNNWPSQPRGKVPDLPLLSWDELSALPPLISLGAHTMTHPDLSRLPAEECERELRECQDKIQQRTGRPVRWLAYPYGATSARVRSLAGRHFDIAVSTSLQFLSPRSDHLNLPRIDAYYFRGWFPLERLFTGSGALYMGLRNVLRYVREFVLQ